MVVGSTHDSRAARKADNAAGMVMADAQKDVGATVATASAVTTAGIRSVAHGKGMPARAPPNPR